MRSVSSLGRAIRHRARRPAASRLTLISKVGALLIGAALLSPLRPAVVVGSSMSPTLEPGQVVWCERGSQLALRRGDVVLARVDGDVCVKRVFAVGGDHFWKTWGASRDESMPQLLDVGAPVGPWHRRYPSFQFHEERVPSGMVYLVGDGISSVDSRKYGPVTTEALIGRVIYPRVPRNLDTCEPSVWSSLPSRPVHLARS